jgi:hypothetical protein
MSYYEHGNEPLGKGLEIYGDKLNDDRPLKNSVPGSPKCLQWL